MNLLETDTKIDTIAAALLMNAGIPFYNCITIPLQGGNNRVYRVDTDKGQYVLKVYFTTADEKKSRLLSEYTFLELVWEMGVRNVPRPVFSDPVKNAALYQYVDGRKPRKNEIKHRHIIDAMDFIETINRPDGLKSPFFSQMGMASDFCEDIREYVGSVNKRIKRLCLIGKDDAVSREAKAFVLYKIVPKWEDIRLNILNVEGDHRPLLEKERIMSPSDFGFHNAIIHQTEDIYFIDFEYAGWDDPVKMICDFFCQPDIPVPSKYQKYCVERVIRIVDPMYDFFNKTMLLLPLFRIKWCCIMLNDFLNIESKRRKYAFFNEDRREKQLERVREYFKQLF